MEKMTEEQLAKLSPKDRAKVDAIAAIVKNVLEMVTTKFETESGSIISMGLFSAFVSFTESGDCESCKLKAYVGAHAGLTERLVQSAFNAGAEAALEDADEDDGPEDEAPSQKH